MDEYQQMYANSSFSYSNNVAAPTYVSFPECYSLTNLRYHYSPPPSGPPPPPQLHQQDSIYGYWPAAAVYMNYYRFGASFPCTICQYYGVYDNVNNDVWRTDISGGAWEYASPERVDEQITTAAETTVTPCEQTTAAVMLPIQEECTSSPQEDVEDGNDGSEVDWQDDIDPDNMTYEELLDLGETVGTQNRGLSQEIIDLLPKTKYKSIGVFSRRRSAERCVICQMRYKRGEKLINLPCKHIYHTHCGSTWLKINKACPICNCEVKFN